MTTVLSISQLSYAYPSGQKIFQIDELNIKAEEHCFIYGPSGSGKSTLLNLISGILPIQTGRLSLLDQDLAELSSSRRDRFRGENLGIIFQNFNLIPYLSVIENLILPSRLYHKSKYIEIKQKAEDYLNRFGLQEQKDKLVTKLSVGQKQRVAAIRAFLTFPKIIIADEPTSSLDQENTKLFMQMLFEISKDLKEEGLQAPTILFVSHDDRLKNYFNRSISLLDYQVNLFEGSRP